MNDDQRAAKVLNDYRAVVAAELLKLSAANANGDPAAGIAAVSATLSKCNESVRRLESIIADQEAVIAVLNEKLGG
jgi:hypothetical protein